MGAYTQFVSGLLFPLHEKLKSHDTVRVRRALERTQWQSPEAIRDLQAHGLRQLFEAAALTPYYGRVFAQTSLDVDAMDPFQVLQQLPFLTKPLIREHYDALVHPSSVGLGKSSTGGSSGEPLIFGLGKRRVTHDVAAKWRATRWWGVDIGDPEAVLWASPIELGAQDRIRLWRDRLFRSLLLPAFEMSDARLDRFIVDLRARRPRMLFGYPSALAQVARHAERRSEVMSDLGAKVAFCTGERLYDDQRTVIERVFGCPVANGYGGRDAGFVAHQCPDGGLHVTAEDIVVELIGSDGQPVPAGTPGEVVVTHLASQDFPFIRYRTGDIAVADDHRCPCGRGLPMLREIQGRSNDFVVALDGTRMQSAALTYVLRELPGIEAFKIVQEHLRLTRVMLVTGPAFPDAGASDIARAFQARLGAGVDVQVERVAAIPAERSGKYRYIISHVTDDMLAAETMAATVEAS